MTDADLSLPPLDGEDEDSTPPKRAVVVRPARAKSLARRARAADHSGFQHMVARASAGAGAGALLADVLARIVDVGLWQSPLLTVGVMAGALAAVSAGKKKWWRVLAGGALGLVGASLFTLASPWWPPFAALLMGIAAAPVLAEGQPFRRKAVTAALAGAASAAGLFVARVMLGWEVFDGVVPSLLGHAAAGATAGLFVGLSGAPKFLGRPLDPVLARYAPALAIKDGEVHGILTRAADIHRSLSSDLAARAEDPSMAKVIGRERELVLQILHIAEECRLVQRDLDATPASEIKARIADLRRRAEDAADAGARATYLDTVAALDEQLAALGRIENGRERVIARLHATVALLEKLRFSLIHLRSADAERIGGQLSPVTEALDALAEELDATSSAVGDVFGRSAGELTAGARADDERPSADVVALPTPSEARASSQKP